MEFIKKNITLVIGIAIPILMIILVAASIYLPALFIQPKYNFIYVNGNDNSYYSQYSYSVRGNSLYRVENSQYDNDTLYTKELKIYFHDVANNKSTEISFEDAQKLVIDSSNISPDGFEIDYGSRGSGYSPFYYSSGVDYSKRYIIGNNVSKELNVTTGGSYYDNFSLIGWVE